MMSSSRVRPGTAEVFPAWPLCMQALNASLRLVLGGAAIVAVAGVIAFVLGRHPLSLAAAVGLGLGLLAILALVLASFHAAVGLGVLLLAVVRIEPAPADAVFAAVIAVALLARFVACPGHETFVGAGDRAQGVFEDPVVFGPFLIPAALILVEEIAKPRLIGWSVMWKTLALVVLALGVVLSYSRAAWLSLA